MTAVEFLVNMLPLIQQEGLRDTIEQAIEMEKQQIIKAHGIKRTRGEIQGISFWESKTGEQYYNETYNKP